MDTLDRDRSGYVFGIDRGGTFTDIVGWLPGGEVVARKVLSTTLDAAEDAAIRGMRQILGVGPGEPFPGDRISAIHMGTTVGTNALLERRGDATAFVVTEGFADSIRIGYQNRPRLFDLDIRLPAPLYGSVVEIGERVDVRGTILVPLDAEAARASLAGLYEAGYRSCAIALMHSYRYPDHERQVKRIALDVGFTHVSASHECSGLIKFVGRAETAVVDAYLTPVLTRYTDRLQDQLAGAPLFFMQSNGGLAQAERFRGKDCILSGPAGGIVGAVTVCKAAGLKKIISFDMGGTSTDVAHYAGQFERTTDSQVAGTRVRSPIMTIHTVAAGGGSIVSIEGRRFRVGPESAGSLPGPSSYRNGGPLTVTDCNVVLGRLPSALFPALFGPNGDLPLDAEEPRRLFQALADRLQAESGLAKTIYECAEGFLDIAIENMANAIKKVSTEKGYNLADYALCSFGGAGGQHACRVARTLNMKTVFVHALGGVLSAYGMGLADLREIEGSSVERLFVPDHLPELENSLDRLEAAAVGRLAAQGVAPVDTLIVRRAVLRYEGASSGLEFSFEQLGDLRTRFEDTYLAHYGFVLEAKAVVVESFAVEAAGALRHETEAADPETASGEGGTEPAAIMPVYVEGRHREVPLYYFDQLAIGMDVAGPAIIIDPLATTVVDPGWSARKTAPGSLVITAVEGARATETVATTSDPILLELFNNRFRAIADQMGHALANSAHSVNIKERLDFSCALFDADSNLIANAPHIPIHLGAMSDSVAAIVTAFGDTMADGDVYVLNSPYTGGAHLPDVTVVMPIFDPTGTRRLFFNAARGHHADIGGRTPGSLPPDSRTILEEGALIEPLRLVHRGRFALDEIRRLLTDNPYPARNPEQNIIDLQAQVASCVRGSREMLALVGEYGEAVVTAYAGYVQDMAEEELRKIVHLIPEGRFTCRHDLGFEVTVAISVDRDERSIRVDFTGTSPQLDSNFNAPPAIARSATLYVFRTLIAKDIPLNAGCLRPIEVVIPDGCFLRPRYPAAVSSGNPETSVLVTDTLYGALGILGCSQGTMNNFTFGNDVYQYYETICGGAGAGERFDGTSAVHTHMTNSLMTDPEVFELRFPVLLEEFSVRPGSGGAGRWSGGCGTKRRVRFLEPVEMAIVSNRRVVPPYGAQGGEPASPGRNRLIRASGEIVELASCDRAGVAPGDVFEILTPGGGGYGVRAPEAGAREPSPSDAEMTR